MESSTAWTTTDWGMFQVSGVNRSVVASGAEAGWAESCCGRTTRSTNTSAVGRCRSAME